MYELDDRMISIYFTADGVWVNGRGPKSQYILYHWHQRGDLVIQLFSCNLSQANHSALFIISHI